MATTRERAYQLDAQDPLRHLRNDFHIPTRAQIHSDTLQQQIAGGDSAAPHGVSSEDEKECTYLCGNSLGLQPKLTAQRIQEYLSTWATQGVQGHFKSLRASSLPTWLDADDRAAEMMAEIVGAKQSQLTASESEEGDREIGEQQKRMKTAAGGGEVAVMQTLTANLHFLMSAFYRPARVGQGRHMIMLEEGAFPSDYIVVETQLRHHDLSPDISMLKLGPPPSSYGILTTDYILKMISSHSDELALILLPGIQYYTGQLLDIPTITAAAHKHGIFIIWDLAHAVGNVELKLHEWNVDAAVWCTYKYLNAGPGSIGGLFVHERWSGADGVSSGWNEEMESKMGATGQRTEEDSLTDNNDRKGEASFAHGHRLAGWWANDKKTRFHMSNSGFKPAPGAAGFQLSNPSILDITSLCSSFEMYRKAGGVAQLRQRSIKLTAFLEDLLREEIPQALRGLFQIITPKEKEWRGAQLSLSLNGGPQTLDIVMQELEKRSVIVDERRPNVVRVAPAPLYNNYADCVDFVEAFVHALRVVEKSGTSSSQGTTVS